MIELTEESVNKKRFLGKNPAYAAAFRVEPACAACGLPTDLCACTVVSELKEERDGNSIILAYPEVGIEVSVKDDSNLPPNWRETCMHVLNTQYKQHFAVAACS